jgi:hypothetical protein
MKNWEWENRSMKNVPTYTATIYIGLKDTDMNIVLDEKILWDVCQRYCDDVGFCVAFTKTDYIYTKGYEPGIIVGIINYPRFPADFESIKEKALSLARLLMKAANQYKVTIVFPNETIMLEREDL